MRKQPPPLTVDQRRAIKLMAPTNSVPEMAERLKLPASRVRRYCIRHDIKVKRATYAPLGDVDIEAEILRCGSVQAVADKYKVTRQAVHFRLQNQ